MIKERNSNFELLRIICMLIIISYHYFVHGGYNINFNNITTNTFLLSLLQWGGKAACNIFIIITGYFMVEKKINFKKIICLILEMFFYSFLINIVIISFNLVEYSYMDLFKTFLPIFYYNWFVITYIQLYLLIPFINKLIKKLTKKDFIYLFIIMIVLFSIIPIFIPGAFYASSNLAIFILMYFIGAYLKKYSPLIYENKKKNFLMMIISIIILILSIAVLTSVGKYFRINTFINNSGYFTSLNSILTIICAVTIFNYFRKIEFKSKIVNNISSSILGIYLVHDNFFMRKIIWNMIFPNVNYVNSDNLIFHLIGKVILVFIVCLVIDKIRIKFFGKLENCLAEKVFKRLNKILMKFNIEGE